jgi:hypothetical protein
VTILKFLGYFNGLVGLKKRKKKTLRGVKTLFPYFSYSCQTYLMRGKQLLLLPHTKKKKKYFPTSHLISSCLTLLYIHQISTVRYGFLVFLANGFVLFLYIYNQRRADGRGSKSGFIVYWSFVL